MEIAQTTMDQANIQEKTVGFENQKIEKVCEYCGAELVQLSAIIKGKKLYFPSYKPCECSASLQAKIHEMDKIRKEIELEKKQNAEQRKIDKINKLFGNSGMSLRARECTFDCFQLNINNTDAHKVCTEYLKDFEIISKLNKNGLFITGDCGVGKSHLAFAIANDLIKQGNSVIAMTMIDLLIKLKSSYSTENQTEEQILKIYEDCVLLVIDDLGKEKPTDWVLQMIYAIIDRRYNAKRPIIITTNFNASELIKRFGDNSIGRAIVDRLFETCQYVPVVGDSFRKMG